MQRDDIRSVLREVFGNIPMQEINGWVSIRCPLARWTHEKGSDASASAGVSIHQEGSSIFNCFTCGTKKPFHEMLRDYAKYTGEDLDDIIEEVEEDEFAGPTSLPEFDSYRNANVAEELTPLKEAVYMDLYDSAAGHPYLRKRGISRKTAELLELKFDPEDPADGHPRILFPVRGPGGELYGFSGRDVSGKAKLKVRDYHGLKKAHCILGAHLIARDNPEQVCVVEGLFDYANMYEQGFYGAAVMHSTMTPYQADILRDLPGTKYLFYDDDQAGDKGVVAGIKALRSYGPTFEVFYPRIWIEDSREPGGGHWLKDPGELEKDEIQEMIDTARLAV